MRKTDLAYVAGLIDGEGCIGAQLHKSKDCSMIFIKVGMADRECVEFLQNIDSNMLHKLNTREAKRDLD